MFNNKKDGGILSLEYDDALREKVSDVFACLIPNLNNTILFDSEMAYRGFSELNKILYPNELQGDMWLLFYAFNRLSEIKVFDNEFDFILDERSFQKSLESNITEIMIHNKDSFIPFLNQNDVDADFEVQKSLEEASDFMYSITLDTYKELSSSDLSTSDVMKYVDILREYMITALSKRSLIVGSKIISGEGVYFNKRKYSGYEDYIEYVNSVKGLISSRFIDYLTGRKKSVSITDLTSLREFRDDNTTKVRKLFYIGFEPLDEVFAICTGDLVTLVADEGTGKTNTAVHIAMQNIMEGNDVLFMTGESSISKIFYMCLSNYIYRETGYMITWKEVMDYEDLDDEESKRIVEMQQSAFVSRDDIGRLHLERKFNYEDFDSKVKEYISKYTNISLVIIDHTDALGSTGTLTDSGYLRDNKQKVDHLFKKEIDLKQEYDIAFLNLAHTSSDTQKAGVKGKDTGVRIGATSSSTTKDADFVFMLSKDLSYADGFIKWSCKKIRDYEDGIKPFMLKKIFEVSELEYDKEYQLAAIEDEDLDIDELY